MAGRRDIAGATRVKLKYGPHWSGAPAGKRSSLESPAPDAAWLAGYRYRGAALPPEAEAVLTRAHDPLFASVRPDPGTARPAAVARGVVEDGWLVITAVTVAEEFRRWGLARAVMAALAAAGRERGAHSCLLQVSEDNAPALALYARLGFTEHHRYHYRRAPLG